MFGGKNEASLDNGKGLEEQVLQEELKVGYEGREQVMPQVGSHLKEEPGIRVKEESGIHVKEVAVEADF
jgi:hypothetical protein